MVTSCFFFTLSSTLRTRVFFLQYNTLYNITQVRIRSRVKFSIILTEVIEMTVKEAVVARFHSILTERRMRANELATCSGVTPSSVYSMLDPRRKEVSVNLVKKLCDGLDMTLGEFFAAAVFDELEQEIR